MRIYLTTVLILWLCACSSVNRFSGASKPWEGMIQQIPGRIECEYYNKGGEGVAYHDTDSLNNGSGKLNPANGNYLNEFRMNEGVDISYTKGGDIDNTQYNKVAVEINKLYVGWTQPSEWTKYYVNVVETGFYDVELMYTANGDGIISLEIDDKPLAENLKVVSTNDPEDSVDWRQWHHWNKSVLGKVKLKKGIHILTLRTVAHGNMNYDYLEFRKN